ncbi:MAG: tetratricopeptide repeat protein [Balneola sp.]|nr:MAG: tetratricopeptide repeat protein [Balneola sp.]
MKLQHLPSFHLLALLLITLIFSSTSLYAQSVENTISAEEVRIVLLEKEVENLSREIEDYQNFLKELYEGKARKHESEFMIIENKIENFITTISLIGSFLVVLLTFLGKNLLVSSVETYFNKQAKNITSKKINSILTEEWIRSEVEEKVKRPIDKAVTKLEKDFKKRSGEIISDSRKALTEIEEVLEIRRAVLEKSGLDNKIGKSSPEDKLKILDFEETLEETKREEDFNADDWFWKGLAEDEREEYNEAIISYSKAIKLNPTSWRAWNNRGYTKIELEKYEEAIEDLNKAIKLDPKKSIGWSNRGVAKMEWGKLEQAISDLDEAIKLDPENSYAWSNRGVARKKIGKSEEAIIDLNEAIRLQQSNSILWSNRGGCKNDLKRFKEAIEDFDKAIELDSKVSNTWNNRGFSKNGLGMYKDAIKDLDKAIELNPKNPYPYAHRSYSYFQLGKLKQAESDSEKAIQLDQNYGRPYHVSGLINQAEGRVDAACEAWKKALELGFQEAQEKLDEFCA